jgi:dolichyl-phosphate-mannose--protein O-mannosyl transferase
MLPKFVGASQKIGGLFGWTVIQTPWCRQAFTAMWTWRAFVNVSLFSATMVSSFQYLLWCFRLRLRTASTATNSPGFAFIIQAVARAFAGTSVPASTRHVIGGSSEGGRAMVRNPTA